jgi:pyroglutamyl-peptidase
MKAPILITGFEPFGGDGLNPSQEVACALDGQQVSGHVVVGRCLPCAFGSAPPTLWRLLDELRPALVLALGLAGSRSAVSIERVAVNLMDARILDNAGEQPIDVPVIAGAEDAHFTSLPVKAIQAAWRDAGVLGEVSYSAGSFVCNQVFFALMHRLRAWPGVKGGFIHLPPLPEQAALYPGARPMTLHEQVRAVRVAISAALQPASTASTESAGRLD